MNIQHLRTFIAIVEKGSFSEAARSLSLSQPAVTMQIRSLETDLGATLLDRRYRKVDLTDAGRSLLPHARAVMEQLEEARVELENVSGEVTGRLSVVASTTPGQYVLPRLFGRFLQDHPQVGLELRVHDTSEVLEAIESGAADLGVTGAKVPGSRVEYEPFVDDELVLVCPPGHPFADRDEVPMADLAAARWVMRETGSGTRMVLEALLRGETVDVDEMDVVIELGTSEAVLSAVEGGLGIGVVSRWVADRAIEDGDVVRVSSPHFPIVRPLLIVLPRGTVRRAARALADLLRAETVTAGG